jgi:hypothetical protein
MKAVHHVLSVTKTDDRCHVMISHKEKSPSGSPDRLQENIIF